jgi:hypothetical protein
MSFTPFALTKSWQNATDFPTYEEDEAKVRADMQCLFDELAAGIQKLITELQKYNTGSGDSGANNVGVDAIAGLTGVTNVQSALATLKTQLDGATQGAVPDNSLTTAKYQDLSVTTPKINDGAVTHDKIGADAVTDANCDFSAGLDVDGDLNVDGDTTLGGMIVLDSDSYGDTLPAPGTPGRLFFLRVQ